MKIKQFSRLIPVSGEIVCRLWTTADLTLCTASILNLCMISVDRYMAVTRALRYSATRTRKKVFGYIAIVWIGALLVSIAPLIVLPLKSVEHTCQVNLLIHFQTNFYLP
jgi:uncharacterized membrane protein YidH (DUF202 family)